MFRFTVFALSFLIYERIVFSARVDQRQTGDLNVQIDLKNLQIVGLMKGKEEYVEYDYAYDYSEMTIKPSSSPTKIPLNITTELPANDKDNTTATTTVFAKINQTTSSMENSSITTEKMAVVTTTPTEANDSSTNPPPSHESIGRNNSTTIKNCNGFIQNKEEKCEQKSQSPLEALLKMLNKKSK